MFSFPEATEVSGRDLFRDHVATEINALVTQKRSEGALDSRQHAGLFQKELKERWDRMAVADQINWDDRAGAANKAACSASAIDMYVNIPFIILLFFMAIGI